MEDTSLDENGSNPSRSDALIDAARHDLERAERQVTIAEREAQVERSVSKAQQRLFNARRKRHLAQKTLVSLMQGYSLSDARAWAKERVSQMPPEHINMEHLLSVEDELEILAAEHQPLPETDPEPTLDTEVELTPEEIEQIGNDIVAEIGQKYEDELQYLMALSPEDMAAAVELQRLMEQAYILPSPQPLEDIPAPALDSDDVDIDLTVVPAEEDLELDSLPELHGITIEELEQDASRLPMLLEQINDDLDGIIGVQEAILAQLDDYARLNTGGSE